MKNLFNGVISSTVVLLVFLTGTGASIAVLAIYAFECKQENVMLQQKNVVLQQEKIELNVNLQDAIHASQQIFTAFELEEQEKEKTKEELKIAQDQLIEQDQELDSVHHLLATSRDSTALWKDSTNSLSVNLVELERQCEDMQLDLNTELTKSNQLHAELTELKKQQELDVIRNNKERLVKASWVRNKTEDIASNLAQLFVLFVGVFSLAFISYQLILGLVLKLKIL